MLYNMLCDIARNDYELVGQIESFYYLDKSFHLVKNISMQPEPRIIGRLLADCESQSEISSKVCLRWIYTVFEFYYRLAHTTHKCSSLKNAPVVYKGDYKSARKNDFFRVYQCYDNFLIEHHLTPCCSRCYDFELELLGANEAGKRKKTYQYQPISPPPPKTYQLSPRYRYLGRPTVNLVKLGGQIKLTPARGANAPRIEGLQCFNLVAPPNAIYKTFPDDAVVYLGGSSPNIHVSSQCPSIKYAFKIYRASYDQARYEDFFRMYKFCDANLARHHIPPVCATCGSFVPDIEGITRKVEDL